MKVTRMTRVNDFFHNLLHFTMDYVENLMDLFSVQPPEQEEQS